VNIRNAELADVDLLMSLVDRLESELPDLPYPDDPADVERAKVERMVNDGVALLAEEEGTRSVTCSRATATTARRPFTCRTSGSTPPREGLDSAAGSCVAHPKLQRSTAAHTCCLTSTENRDAIAFYNHLGFEEGAKIFHVAVETLLQARESRGESIGALHVQSDDAQAVERVVNEFLPRLMRGGSATVEGSRTWTAVRVTPFDRDALRQLGRELSYRFGVTVILALEEEAVVHFVIHDQGRMVDEYLSVPEFYGPLPPGDVLALRSNPTVVSRLTGADAARVRAVARTADMAGDLPPASEIYAQLAELMGLQE
jgi:hypothetical protein